MANPNPKAGPGRPKGAQNKITKEIKEIARSHGVAAVKALANIMNSKKEMSGARIAAAKELLDRGFGKSPQPVDGDGQGGPIQHALTVRFVKP